MRTPRPTVQVTRLLDENGLTAPPVPVARLAHRLGLKVVSRPLEADLSGFLLRRGGKALIGVNSHHAQTRQRFTIAHEIGHYLLGEDDEQLHVDRGFDLKLRDLTAKTGTDAAEIKANRFAAELLMPEPLLRGDVERLALDPFDEKGIRELARQYGVSMQALVIRLGTLGLA